VVELKTRQLPRLGSDELADLPGQGRRVLLLYKAGCPTCRIALPLLEQLYRRGEGIIDIVAVSQDSLEETEDFVRDNKITMPVYLDNPGWPLSTELGLASVPVLLQLDGELLGSTIEGFSREEYRRAMELMVSAAGLEWDCAYLFDNPELPDFKPG